MLVTNDMLGLTDGYVPRFVKAYADLGGVITGTRPPIATKSAAAFPAAENAFVARSSERRGAELK